MLLNKFANCSRLYLLKFVLNNACPVKSNWKKKIYPFRAPTSRSQPQHTRTATYTTASCKQPKPQTTKATKNKLIQKCICESSSSFAQSLKIQFESASILPIALEISLFINILFFGKYAVKLARGTLFEMRKYQRDKRRFM